MWNNLLTASVNGDNSICPWEKTFGVYFQMMLALKEFVGTFKCSYLHGTIWKKQIYLSFQLCRWFDITSTACALTMLHHRFSNIWLHARKQYNEVTESFKLNAKPGFCKRRKSQNVGFWKRMQSQNVWV